MPHQSGYPSGPYKLGDYDLGRFQVKIPHSDALLGPGGQCKYMNLVQMRCDQEFWRLWKWQRQWWMGEWTEATTPVAQRGILAQVWHPVPTWIPPLLQAIGKTFWSILSLPMLVTLLSKLYLSKPNPSRKPRENPLLSSRRWVFVCPHTWKIEPFCSDVINWESGERRCGFCNWHVLGREFLFSQGSQ